MKTPFALLTTALALCCAVCCISFACAASYEQAPDAESKKNVVIFYGSGREQQDDDNGSPEVLYNDDNSLLEAENYRDENVATDNRARRGKSFLSQGAQSSGQQGSDLIADNLYLQHRINDVRENIKICQKALAQSIARGRTG